MASVCSLAGGFLQIFTQFLVQGKGKVSYWMLTDIKLWAQTLKTLMRFTENLWGSDNYFLVEASWTETEPGKCSSPVF